MIFRFLWDQDVKRELHKFSFWFNCRFSHSPRGFYGFSLRGLRHFLEYLEGDVETVPDLENHAKWCAPDEAVEERLRKEPRSTVNFQSYERGLGNEKIDFGSESQATESPWI